MSQGKELADWETIAKVQALMGKEFEFEAALYDEFGIGNSPHGRGASGLHGGVTKGQALSYAMTLRDSIEKKKKRLDTLRGGCYVQRTHAICDEMLGWTV